MKALGFNAVGPQDLMAGQQDMNIGDLTHVQVDGNCRSVDQFAGGDKDFIGVEQGLGGGTADQHSVIRRYQQFRLIQK